MKVLVLGAAVSGRAAAELSRRQGHVTAVYDRRSAAVRPLRDRGFEVHSGSWNAGLLRGVDLVVASPGFGESSPPITDTAASGIPLWAEIEFASRALTAPYVAVTGTNGKTTVTEALAAMLERSGRRTIAAGNVGTPLASVVDQEWDIVVVEASSFQLRFVDTFHPFAAGVTNLAPDHLDWHGSFERYATAKAEIHRNMEGDDLFVFNADDVAAARLAARARCRLQPVSGTSVPPHGIGVDAGALAVGEHRLHAGTDDPSYLLDLAVAAALAIEAGAGIDAIATVVEGFRPGAHRRELVADAGGIRWVNDSKATNPHAAAAAAAAYRSVVLLAGGKNKGLDLTPLTQVPAIRRIVAFGESAGEIAAAAPEVVDVVDDLDAAIGLAEAIARSGDTVLLAPGCASFDQFTSYEERGDTFRRSVQERTR